MCENGKP